MESIAIFDRVQFEKAKAMLCYNRLGSGVAKLLCVVELLGAVVILCWCSSRLPLALLFFRSVSGFLAGHVFCFIVSNVIIITLLANSLSSPPAANSESDLYAADMSDSISEIHGHIEAVPFQDKEMIPEVPVAAAKVDGDADFDFPKAFRRSKSAKYYCSEKSAVNKGAVLRRSETKTYCREAVNLKEEEEEMSNEEFQRTIEEFIAKQLKFRRQESISGVVS